MQFVRVKFKPWDRQTWTYANEGPDYDFQPGDLVIVSARGRLQEVEVTACYDVRPADVPENVTIKAIESIVPRKAPGQGDDPSAQ